MPFIADYTKPLIYDPPRQLDLFGSAAAYFGLDAAARRAEHRQPEEPASAEIGLQIHQHDQGAGRRRS